MKLNGAITSEFKAFLSAAVLGPKGNDKGSI
jgi:hypothetical protein